MELKAIEEKYPELKKRVGAMLKAEKLALLLKNASSNEGVVVLLKQMKLLIESINDNLLNDIELSECERLCLMSERSCWEWLLRQFYQEDVLRRINNFKKKYE